jgi:sirohydrochlorin cobaltochelatase
VERDSFSDAALVVLGHGSTVNAASAQPVFQHAAELRRRALFASVHEAFWKQEPKVVDVLKRISHARVLIVPFFVSEGYFAANVIPRALGFEAGAGPASRLRQTGSSQWFYCRPVGTQERMTAVLLQRARDVIAQAPFPRAPQPKDVTLIIAGHGTEQEEASRKSIEVQVERIRSLGEYAEVQAAFMEEEPRIAGCHRAVRTRNVVIVPFFISDGMHTQEDIPVLLGEPERVVKERLAQGRPTWRNPTEREGKRIWYAPAVGSEPTMAEVILERVKEAMNEFGG